MTLLQAYDRRGKEPVPTELFVKSCGYFYDIGAEAKGTNRPLGRKDYQLIRIIKGCLLIKDDCGGEREVPAGSVVIYRPRQPQRYHCRAEDNTAYYWIHFTGSAVERLLKQCDLYGKSCFSVSVNIDDLRLIQGMITEINHKQYNYRLNVLSLFLELLTGISRQMTARIKEQKEYARLIPALTAMEQELHIPYTVEDYAAMCTISPYYFLHLFKSYVGETPMQYRDRHALERACRLLSTTELAIGEVARAVGIEDALYFSKKFKRHFGVPPTIYRKQSRADN